jgi:hypothetical protein
MDITLSTVTDAARQRLAAVTAEAAGYLVLLVVQQVATYPCHVRLDGIFLTDAGDVVVRGGGEAGAGQVELELRQMLTGLLALAQSATPALRAAAERSGTAGLHQLQAELQAALIPINHAAARRALARLYRETLKASSRSGQHSSMTSEPEPTPTSTPSVPGWRTPVPVHSESLPPLVRSALASPESERRPCNEERQDALEIDVDIVDDDPLLIGSPSWTGSPSAGSTPLPPLESRPRVASSEPAGHCSDVSELLASFLSHTRSEERMAEALRKLLGVDAGRVVPPLDLDSAQPRPRP